MCSHGEQRSRGKNSSSTSTSETQRERATRCSGGTTIWCERCDTAEFPLSAPGHKIAWACSLGPFARIPRTANARSHGRVDPAHVAFWRKCDMRSSRRLLPGLLDAAEAQEAWRRIVGENAR